MWNVRKENDQVILVVNGEKALCRQGKEFGPVKGITTGKRSGELVVSIFFFFLGGGGGDRWGRGGGGWTNHCVFHMCANHVNHFHSGYLIKK